MPPERDINTAIKISSAIRSLRKKNYDYHGGVGDAAKKLGVHRQLWTDWEAGRKVPSDENQRKLADFFGVSVSELRGEAEPAGEPSEAPQSYSFEEMLRLKDEMLAIYREQLAAERRHVERLGKELDHEHEHSADLMHQLVRERARADAAEAELAALKGGASSPEGATKPGKRQRA